MKKISLSFAFLLICFSVWGQSLERKLFSTGGGSNNIGLFQYDYSLGEVAIGTYQNNLPGLTIGFHQPNPQIVLPISIEHFQVRKQGQSVILSWQLMASEGGSQIEIERSTDQGVFTPINRLPVYGASQQLTGMYFEDKEAIRSGVSWLNYRLRLLDASGAILYSTIERIKLQQADSPTATLFPNPASKYTALQLFLPHEANVQVHILNPLGQSIHQERWKLPAGEHQKAIPLGQLAQGQYLLRVSHTSWEQNIRLLIVR
ncbi:MAG: T9SS type A sorting domain-containing protein [Bacteroidota bacterium]